MDQGYKHFSHSHNLVIHQMPEGTEVSCAGCHSSATRTVYVCWQCNFFLHDQCYRATRSMKHPSHPPHSLTLVPYPTYPSNSFYCNSCQIKGTGFSYSCVDCEFDLHVHCAYSVSGPTSWNGVPNSNISNNIPFTSLQFNHAQNIHHTPPTSIPHVPHHPTPHDQAYHNSMPLGSQNPIPTIQNPPIPTPNSSITHFTHPHNLSIVNLNKENKVVCSACQDTLIGNGYSCLESHCNFHLHKSCFHLKREIHHKSHPEHPLQLLLSNGEFTCNACFNNHRGFTYHCFTCKFNLHIQCVNLPEAVKRPDHEHLLQLYYSFPVKGEFTVTCDVCYTSVEKEGWVYRCDPCNCGTHVGCVNSEKQKKEPVVSNPQVDLQRMQLELQMSQQLAQMMAGMGASIANLV